MGRTKEELKQLHANALKTLRAALGDGQEAIVIQQTVESLLREKTIAELRSRFGDWPLADLAAFSQLLSEPAAAAEPASVKKPKR